MSAQNKKYTKSSFMSAISMLVVVLAGVGVAVGSGSQIVRASEVFEGYVTNTSGGRNFVKVGADGKPVVTPVMNTSGQYTASLDPASLSQFMNSNGLSQSCGYAGSSSGGSGGGSDGGVTYYTHNGEDFTIDSNGNSWGGNTPYNSGVPSNYTSSSTSSSSSSSSGGSTDSRVICTHFYRARKLSRELWRADMEFTFNHLSRCTIRGYHFWAIPYVRLMRRSKLAEAIMYPVAIHRAEELAYQMGLRDKPNYLGKFFRLLIEPVCFVIGIFVPEQNWQSLYKDEKGYVPVS